MTNRIIWTGRSGIAAGLLSLLLACATGARKGGTPPNATPPHRVPASSPASARVDPSARSIPSARPGLAAGLDAYIEGFGSHWGEPYRFSGHVLVMQDGEPIYERGFGRTGGPGADVPGMGTSFRIGSVTKQFTAAATLVLASEGRLALHDRVQEHLPAYRGPAADVTIHQLLSHTAGVPEITETPPFEATRATPTGLSDMLAMFADRPLDFPPGSEFRYSNAGYLLLGAVLEAAAGASYAEILQRCLFTPAGMTDTVFGDATDDPDRARGFRVLGNRLLDARPFAMKNAHAAGGLRSTARDLLRWDRALRAGRILPAAQLAPLFKPVQKTYAYGWFVHDTPLGRVASHDGGIDGFITTYARGLERDLVIVVWSNTERQHPPLIANAALSLLAGEQPPAREETPEQPFDPVDAEQHVGRWRLPSEERKRLLADGTPGRILEMLDRVSFDLEPDCLVFKRPQRDDVCLFRDEQGGYFSKGPPGIRIEFEPRALKLQQGPQRVHLAKQPGE